MNKASAHRTAEASYQMRRRTLLSELQAVEGHGPYASAPGKLRRQRQPSNR
jgi:hypothetical protein